MSRTIRLTVGQAVVKYLSAQFSERDGKRRRLIPGMFGILGHGNVAGLGQGLIEDGTYLMNPSEILTAVQEGLKITVVIAENHGFQSIRGLQMLRVGQSFGNEFRARDRRKNKLEGDYLKVDLAQNAASLGARTWRANREEQLAEALRAARREVRPCVIVVETQKHRYLPPAGRWMEFEPAEATNDPVTRKVRKDYEAQRRRAQRFHY